MLQGLTASGVKVQEVNTRLTVEITDHCNIIYIGLRFRFGSIKRRFWPNYVTMLI